MKNEGQLKSIFDALAFSARKHRDQRRKDTNASPYINHPIDLARVLVVEGGIEDASILAAALLHDTVEDTDTTPDELADKFGEVVKDLVLEVTDDKELAKSERKRLQVEHAKHISFGARAIKLADKISNLRDILENPPADWPLERRQQYFDWAKEVVDNLRGNHPVLESIFDDLYLRRPRG